LTAVQAYENIKKRSKKAAAEDRAMTFKTGGGTFIPTMDEVDQKVVGMLGNRATPLYNAYDSTAEYCSQGELNIHYILRCRKNNFSV